MAIRISAIAAMSQNRVIGIDNAMPWHLPEDFKHFKRTTMGKPVIMGRKTYESLGKPLPGRANIVISRTPGTIKGDAIAVATIDDAITRAKEIATSDHVDEIFIIGGAQIFAETLHQTQRIYLTIIHQDYKGDTVFPTLNMDEWHETAREDHIEPQAFSIVTLDRK